MSCVPSSTINLVLFNLYLAEMKEEMRDERKEEEMKKKGKKRGVTPVLFLRSIVAHA